jgi:hypothetical protein
VILVPVKVSVTAYIAETEEANNGKNNQVQKKTKEGRSLDEDSKRALA